MVPPSTDVYRAPLRCSGAGGTLVTKTSWLETQWLWTRLYERGGAIYANLQICVRCLVNGKGVTSFRGETGGESGLQDGSGGAIGVPRV